MTTKKSIVACKVLRKNFNDIVTALQDRSIQLETVLLSEKVLSESQFAAAVDHHRGAPDAQRVRDILKVILAAVETDGRVYDKFISYLKSEVSLEFLVNLLQETYDLSAKSVPDFGLPEDTVTDNQHEFSSDNVVLYISYVKDSYAVENFPAYLKYPRIILNKPKWFNNLVMAHKEKEMCSRDDFLVQAQVGELGKNRIEMREVGKLHDGSVAQCILIEGSPGIGKTTLAWELCRRWKTGEMLQQFWIVLLLQLCNPCIKDANSLHDLLYHITPEVKSAACDYMLARGGKGVMLIFEGFDEILIPHCSQGKVLCRLLSKSLLPFATVLVTTRPVATRQLPAQFLQKVDQHIEILGFGKEDIDAYVEESCQNEPVGLLEDFQLYLSSHSFAESVMFVPLQCAIVTELYISGWKKGKKKLTPTTMTELYTTLVLSIMLQYLSIHPVYGRMELEIKVLADLPLKPREQLMQLAKVAADGIEQQKYTFEEIPCDALAMGFVCKVNDMLARTTSLVAYSFPHMTLQEYFAALHWSQLPVKELTNLIRRPNLFPIEKLVSGGIHDRMDSTIYHWPVLLFLAGLTNLTGIPASIIEAHFKLEPQADQTTKRVFSCSLGQLLFESQNPTMPLQIFANGWFCAFGPSVLDSYVIGYCITNSSSTAFWEVGYGSEANIPSHIHSFVKGLSLPSASGQRGQIRRLCFDLPELMEYMSLLPMLFPFLKDLKELFLLGELNQTNLCSELLKLIPSRLPQLEQLHIKSSNTSAEWIPLLESVSHFPRISFVGISLPSQAGIPQMHLPRLIGVHTGLSFCPALVLPNKYALRTLQVHDIRLSSDDVAIVTELLSYMLSTLFIRNCFISVANFHRVASAAAISNCLKTFATINNNIGIQGATEIVVFMLQNRILMELQVLEDSITSDGAATILNTLAESCIRCLALPIKYTDIASNYPHYLLSERVVLV